MFITVDLVGGEWPWFAPHYSENNRDHTHFLKSFSEPVAGLLGRPLSSFLSVTSVSMPQFKIFHAARVLAI